VDNEGRIKMLKSRERSEKLQELANQTMLVSSQIANPVERRAVFRIAKSLWIMAVNPTMSIPIAALLEDFAKNMDEYAGPWTLDSHLED